MGVTSKEFYQTLYGEADDSVRQRVCKAIEDKEPLVMQIIEDRARRAREWLRLISDPRTGMLVQVRDEDGAALSPPLSPEGDDEQRARREMIEVQTEAVATWLRRAGGPAAETGGGQ